MEEEEDQPDLLDLVKKWVHYFLSQNLPTNSPPLKPAPPNLCNSLRYALHLATHARPAYICTLLCQPLLQIRLQSPKMTTINGSLTSTSYCLTKQKTGTTRNWTCTSCDFAYKFGIRVCANVDVIFAYEFGIKIYADGDNI